MSINMKPIGIIHSVFEHTHNSARQPAIDGRKGHILLHSQFTEGLQGLDEFSHIIAVYYFHLQSAVKLKAKPCFDPDIEHGIFASRYPTRPNHIGISVLSLESIVDNIIFCRDVDVVNNTPLLDIKPYVKQFDQMENARCGWYDTVCWSTLDHDVKDQDIKNNDTTAEGISPIAAHASEIT